MAPSMGFTSDDIKYKSDLTRRKIRSSYLKADIYYQSFNVRNVSQSEKYDVSPVYSLTFCISAFQLNVARCG